MKFIYQCAYHSRGKLFFIIAAVGWFCSPAIFDDKLYVFYGNITNHNIRCARGSPRVVTDPRDNKPKIQSDWVYEKLDGGLVEKGPQNGRTTSDVGMRWGRIAVAVLSDHDCYKYKMDLVTNGVVITDAIKFVQQKKEDLRSQNNLK